MRSRSMLCPWVPKTGSEDATDLFCTPVVADNIKFGDVRLNAVRATENLELFPDYWRLWAAEIRLWVLVVIVSFSTNPSNSSSSVLNRKCKLETLETWDEHSCTWEFITWVTRNFSHSRRGAVYSTKLSKYWSRGLDPKWQSQRERFLSRTFLK
jgi:hypothetical protein